MEFQGLQISVKGKAERAASFVQRLALDSGRWIGDPPGLGWHLRSAISLAFVFRSAECGILAGGCPPVTNTKARDQGLPETPLSLSMPCTFDATTSGGWVPGPGAVSFCGPGRRAVQAGRVGSLNRAPAIDIGNRFYAVIKGPNINPKVYKSSLAQLAMWRDQTLFATALEGKADTPHLEIWGRKILSPCMQTSVWLCCSSTC